MISMLLRSVLLAYIVELSSKLVTLLAKTIIASTKEYTCAGVTHTAMRKVGGWLVGH